MTNLLKEAFKILIVTIGLHFSLCTHGMSWDAMRGWHVTPARNPAPIPLPHLERSESNPAAQQTLGRLLTTAQHQEQSRSLPSLSSSETSAFRPYSSSSSRTALSLPSRPEISLELDAEGWQLTAPENRAPAWDDVRGWYLVPSSEQTRRPLPPFEQVRTHQPAEGVLDQRTSSISSSSSSSSSSRKRGKESEESSTGQFKRPCLPARATGQIPTALISPEQAASREWSQQQIAQSSSSSSSSRSSNQPLSQICSATATELLSLSQSLSPEVQDMLKQTTTLLIKPSPLFDNSPGFFINIVAQYFPNLLYLDLTNTRLSDEGFRFLAHSSLAPKLKVLAVENCGITDSSFTTQNLNRFARLEYFNVRNNPLTDPAINAFANSRLPWRMTNFSNTLNLELLNKVLHTRNIELRSRPLTLALNQFNEEHLSHIHGLENKGALEIIGGTEGTTVPVDFIKLIEKYFPNILSLRLSNVAAGDEGFTALAESTIALQLQALNISNSGLTDSSFTTQNLNKFNNLSRLIVRDSFLGASGFKALIESKLAPRLNELALIATHIPKEVFTTNNFAMFKQLTSFGLDGNQLGDKVFTELADSAIALQLRILTISNCGITNSSFTTQNLNRFVKLEVFDVRNNPLTDVAINAFVNSRLPGQLKHFFNDFNQERLREATAQLNELKHQAATSKS